ncbi:MAG: hypothetical protein OJF60_001761 [Burkholderiaceae bacterium]|nr:MAG: hypothetical protein OJF60_001761 [Burkholderiaceae bacterium]
MIDCRTGVRRSGGRCPEFIVSPTVDVKVEDDRFQSETQR